MSRVSDRPANSPDLPAGNVTFLFTDLEESSAAWERRPRETRVALHYHDRVAMELTRANGGVLIKHTGDGVKSVFTTPADALAAAVAMQKQFQQESWNGEERMRVRIGLHSGPAQPDGDDYYGGVINRAARVADVANGDQIAVTTAVVTQAESSNAEFGFVDCGVAQLRGCGQERVFLVEADGLIVDDRPLRIRRTLAGSALPPEGGRLIGRELEMRRLQAFLQDRRLTSVVGLGGMGKTRLAVAAARARSSDFADGVVYCPLSPIAAESPNIEASVLAALAEALGARRQPGHDLSSSIVNFVERRDVLVLLDNCEHVKPAVRAIVERVLSVDGPTVLVTSREPLDLAGEQRLNLDPLPTDSDAIELLIERAIERDPAFDMASDEATLREICRRLDGIPLALELAAARLRILTPDRLLEGLSRGQRVLGTTAGSENGQLHSTVAWSVDQLDDRQQQVLERLCIFSGGFTLEAASAILAIDDDVTLLDDLTHLVELSLVNNRPGQGDIRFSMLETIRQFGIERLRQRSEQLGRPIIHDLSVAHAKYYSDFASECGRNLMTSAEAEIWTRIDSDSDNIRVAFEHLVSTEMPGDAAEVVVDLAWFATLSMRMEIFAWAKQLLELPDAADNADLWAVRSIGQYLSADNDSQRSAQRSLQLDPSDPTGLASTTLASVGLNNTFDPELTDKATDDLLSYPSDRSKEKRIAGLGLRSFHLCLLAPSSDAVEMARIAVREAEATGSASAMTIGYWARAVSNLLLDTPTANESIHRGLAMAKSLTENHLISHLLNGLVVHFASLTESVHEAAATTATEIRATMDKHYLVGASHLLGAASVVLCRAGRPDDGAALFGAMVSNGHRPRREIRQTVESVLGDSMSAAIAVGDGWSINEAGQRAVRWLDEVAAAEAAP